MEAYKLLIHAPDTLVLVAERAGGEIVGYLLASTHVTFLANGPVGWVEELMVDQEARGSGVGRALMESAEQWAQDAGAAYLSLATRRAPAFYAALDYDESAVFFKKTFV